MYLLIKNNLEFQSLTIRRYWVRKVVVGVRKRLFRESVCRRLFEGSLRGEKMHVHRGITLWKYLCKEQAIQSALLSTKGGCGLWVFGRVFGSYFSEKVCIGGCSKEACVEKKCMCTKLSIVEIFVQGRSNTINLWLNCNNDYLIVYYPYHSFY